MKRGLSDQRVRIVVKDRKALLDASSSGVQRLMWDLITRDDRVHQQTLNLPISARDRLAVLAKITGKSASYLASALLVAAIDDACDYAGIPDPDR